MGLDVYLKSSREEFDDAGGYPEWEKWHDRTTVNLPSAKYPDHLFKIGYFRSSYNGSGFNSVMGSLGVPDLYDIFPHKDESRMDPVDWQAEMGIAQDALAKLREAVDGEIGKVAAMSVISGGEGIESEHAALSIYLSEAAKWKDKESDHLGDGYFTRGGSFFPKGITVRAIFRAASPYVNSIVVYDMPKGSYQHYVESMEIVVETVEWVLAQPNPQDYWLYWSG